MQGAAAAGISVQERSLALEELISIVTSRQYLVIALVDKHILLKGTHALEGPRQPGPQYTGHYVVLHGFDPESNQFLVNDPAMLADAMWVPALQLDASRKAYGTDEDLLFIPVSNGT